MEKCKQCGEWIDWDNPNIHYGGHICKSKETVKTDIEIGFQCDNIEIKKDSWDMITVIFKNVNFNNPLHYSRELRDYIIKYPNR